MLEALQHGGIKEVKTYIYRKMWYPDYRWAQVMSGLYIYQNTPKT